ncbi:Rsd/AlgQ family anti-sigma factor [Gayadomonas joobiniege]|uniref:Rsd/AlgQ family anti-sigma factor n=1 Tax=Gayadomonas joobiniege TaxID=1234606 RepID=UPI00037C7052|nr:Rsd/AlgQ family anti-sigma factor [Gayadomonas joobiniege]
MLTDVKKAQQKYGGTNATIDKWLAERRELLASYCTLAGLPPYEKDKSCLPSAEEVRRFCQVLVDYLSAGHFEIYDNIVSQCTKNGEESKKLADSLWPKINKTTDWALTFDDTYAEITDDGNWDNFDKDLSTLGQTLEDRFAYEDELIHALATKHTEVA